MRLAYSIQTSVEMPKVSPQEFRGDVRLMSTWPMPVTPLRANKPEREGPKIEKFADPRFGAAPSALTLPTINAPAPTPSASFAGLSLNDAVTGGQAGAGYPPDTNGDVGPKHFILSVNDAYAIYDKATGTRLAAFTENALWAGVGSRMARKPDPPDPKFNQGLHLRPKLRDLRVGECPGNSTDETGDAKIVDTAHTSGAPAVHD